MTHLKSPFLAVLLLGSLLPLSLSGCGWGGSGPQRHDVRGQVTYKGQPIPAGLVRLTPDRAKGNTGPGAVANIDKGFFQTKSGKGVVSGPHVIVIAGFDGVAQPDGSLPEGAALFHPYTTQWDFENKTSVVDIEVPSKKDR